MYNMHFVTGLRMRYVITRMRTCSQKYTPPPDLTIVCYNTFIFNNLLCDKDFKNNMPRVIIFIYILKNRWDG